MKIISQGLMGFADSFLHADYLSSVSRIDYVDYGSANTGFIIGIILFTVAFVGMVYFYIRKKSQKKKQQKENATESNDI